MDQRSKDYRISTTWMFGPVWRTQSDGQTGREIKKTGDYEAPPGRGIAGIVRKEGLCPSTCNQNHGA